MQRFFYILLIILQLSSSAFSQSVFTARNISMSAEVPMDARIDSIVGIYSDSLSARMSRVIGVCSDNMESKRPESDLMRFVADALMADGLKYAKANGIDYPAVALINAGGIRSNMRKGDITVGDIYEISPFENSVVLMVLTARQLRDVCYHIAYRKGEATSGLSFAFTPGENNAKRIRIQDEPIDNDKQYLLITLDYVATGGDQFKCLTSIPHTNTGHLFREALISYIEEITARGEQITPPKEERLKVVKSNY